MNLLFFYAALSCVINSSKCIHNVSLVFFVAIELIMNSPGAVNGFWSVMMDGGAGMMNIEKST